MITVRHAADRFRTEQPGITSRNCFSSGAHYDPSNLSFGPVVACDEHLLDPGAGFEPHPHARVELVTWVLEGTLRHEDADGMPHLVQAGCAQYQLAGTGIVHAERNASSTEPLHLVQQWLLCDEEVPDYDIGDAPLELACGRFDVLRSCVGTPVPAAPFVHLYVATGRYEVSGHEVAAGDSLRVADRPLVVTGEGDLLVITVV